MNHPAPCPICAELHDLATRTPVWLSVTAGSWTISLPKRRVGAFGARWTRTSTHLGDLVRDARSAVTR